MRPAPAVVLAAIVAELEENVACFPQGPEQALLGNIRTIISAVLLELDSAAASRLEEIGEMRCIIELALPICPQELGDRLVTALEETKNARDDLRVSVLEKKCDTLMAAFIELQAWLEDASHPQAARLLKRCWAFLVSASPKRTFWTRPW